MIGVAVGLGNVWRFPYMVGEFGGAAFVLAYMVTPVVIGIPALMAEWALGRATRRGTVGAFERAGLPFGRALGWVFFGAVICATAYYCNAIGWVLFHALAMTVQPLGIGLDASIVLPPDTGFAPRSFVLQLLMTSVAVGGCALVLVKGLRRGIEAVSKVVTPLLFGILILLIVRSVTLPGAGEGLRWFILKFELSALSGGVVLAALGQVVFSMALGGTFMVVYGSYLNPDDDLGRNAIWTAAGDTLAGLLAGLAIFPAVFALGLEPGSGPGLIFSTIPEIFSRIPGGSLFGILFFLALFGAAYLSAVAAFEVLVAGVTDNTSIGRVQSSWMLAAGVLVLAVPPMINMRIFVPWDLTFGSGFQTVGALVAALTVGWCLDRGKALEELARGSTVILPGVLYLWIRWVIPGAILAVGGWWLFEEVLGG